MSVPQNGVITRQRLLELGDGAKPITLISAPAGYGKTTLLRQWPPVTGAVVRLDPAEIGDGWELWHRLDNALRLADVTVILDDVHLLDSSRKTSELKRALDLAGTDRRLVIATRRDPILELHDARLAGNVLEIRADDLAFDEAETRLFLAMNHITATPEQARALGAHRRLASRTSALDHAAVSRSRVAGGFRDVAARRHRRRQLSHETGTVVHIRGTPQLLAANLGERVSRRHIGPGTHRPLRCCPVS